MLIRLAAWSFICCFLGVYGASRRSYTPERKTELRDEVGNLFRHGFEGYMNYAHPADELKPLSCKPLYRDPDPGNFGLNDVHANISLTLLDTLTSLPLIHPSAFPSALEKVVTQISFDQDVKTQVFEMTIRALGSLLSTYQYLDRLPTDPKDQARTLGIKGKVDVRRHRERVLEMALDLGKRFLPAFETPTGIPYSRVNLRHGVEPGESQDTCAAGAGSLILEFAVLSRLTGDDRFETLARNAYLAIWNRRSPHDLIGNTIGALHGHWLVPGLSGVGAGIDSFFEYGIKASILLDDDAYLDIFHDSYAAIQTHIRTPDGFIYRPVQFRNLQTATPSAIDSLAAFIPGMQILAGDIESAIKTHLVYWNLWRKYSAMPESWDWENRKVVWAGWPGRPEYIEATYYLYKVTKDPFYLKVGERVLHDVKRRVKTSCGFATMRNIETGELEDRMESFVLSETLKYLYLLFSEDDKHHLDNTVFSTEGHPLSLPTALHQATPLTRRILHRGENQQCPVYRPPRLRGLRVGIEQRADYEYARSLVYGLGRVGSEAADESVYWSESGYCEVPVVPRYSVGIALSPLNGSSIHDDSMVDAVPITSKVIQDEMSGDYVISNVSNLPLTVHWRLDNRGYDVATIGPHRVRSGQQVYVTDPRMEGYIPVARPNIDLETHRPAEVVLRFSTDPSAAEGSSVFLHALATTATFGRDFGDSHSSGWKIEGPAMKLKTPAFHDRLACLPLKDTYSDDSILLIDRGDCTFSDKLLYATRAGAAGVILVDSGEHSSPMDQPLLSEPVLLRPNADGESPAFFQEVLEAGMVFTSAAVGHALGEMGKQVEGEIWVEALHLDMGLEGGSQEDKGKMGSRGREGRLALGEWEIWNLRIVAV